MGTKSRVELNVTQQCDLFLGFFQPSVELYDLQIIFFSAYFSIEIFKGIVWWWRTRARDETNSSEPFESLELAVPVGLPWHKLITVLMHAQGSSLAASELPYTDSQSHCRTFSLPSELLQAEKLWTRIKKERERWVHVFLPPLTVMMSHCSVSQWWGFGCVRLSCHVGLSVWKPKILEGLEDHVAILPAKFPSDL